MSNRPYVTDENFEDAVLKAPNPVLVQFTASWCGPCKTLAPTMNDLAREYHGEVHVFALDVEASEATAKRYSVSTMPTVILFSGGKECVRTNGVKSRSHYAVQLDAELSK